MCIRDSPSEGAGAILEGKQFRSSAWRYAHPCTKRAISAVHSRLAGLMMMSSLVHRSQAHSIEQHAPPMSLPIDFPLASTLFLALCIFGCVLLAICWLVGSLGSLRPRPFSASAIDTPRTSPRRKYELHQHAPDEANKWTTLSLIHI